jgi:hypothetical protein
MTTQESFPLASVLGSGDPSQRRTAARRVRTLSIACVFLGATASTATGQKLAITASAPTPQHRRVTFEELLARSVILELADYPRGEIELYRPSATAEDRAKQSCRLTVADSRVALDQHTPGEPCRALLVPLWRGEPFTLAVSVASTVPGTVSIPYGVVEYERPLDYEVPDTAIEVSADASGAPSWRQAEIPKAVTLISSDCYAPLDRLRKLTCDPATRVVTPDTVTASMMAARWRLGKEVSLIARVADAESETAWRVFPFRLKAKLQTDPTTHSPQQAFEQRCREAASSVDAKATSFYLVCVDALAAHRGLVTLSCEKPDSTTCSIQHDLVDAGRDFIVAVWTDGKDADVSLSGVAGYSWTYDPAGREGDRALEKAGGDRAGARGEAARQVVYLGPRKPGTSKLIVTVETAGDPIEVEREYTIRASYHVAIRLGLGISWAPWAREVDVQTAADGQRYAAVVSGAGGGLVENELVAGISYFPWPIKQDSLDLRLALGLRLGVVDIGSGGGWFRSLMVGPELAIGPDLAIGIFGGIRRTDLPDAGYEPGRLLLPGTMEIPTHVGVTPAFGVVLNFTPGFLDFFGV